MLGTDDFSKIFAFFLIVLLWSQLRVQRHGLVYAAECNPLLGCGTYVF